MNWLQEHAWLVTLGTALLAATIAITLYLKNKKRKTLDWVVLDLVSVPALPADFVYEPLRSITSQGDL